MENGEILYEMENTNSYKKSRYIFSVPTFLLT
jgi:hypothetical protein